jgi:predicted GNAT superfamily acetyltransferase
VEPAWDLAHAAAERAGVALRTLDSLEDAQAVRGVIEVVWGAQVMPRELLRAFQHAGSVLVGAADRGDGAFAGFVLGFLGWDGGLHLHSHMLAVVPARQCGGIGAALKLAQRATCLEHGVDEVRWTFDPLVARNARFNLVKLGASATRLLASHYGQMTDRLNAGDRSDRFEVRWRLQSERTDGALHGRAISPPSGPVLLERGPSLEPVETGAAPEPGAVIRIPADHFELRRRDSGLGRAWRDASVRASRACFEAGLEAVWFDDQGGYVFDAPERLR